MHVRTCLANLARACAAAAAFAAAGPAFAATVYSGPQNILLPDEDSFPTPGPAYFINLETGAHGFAEGTENAVAGWDIGFYYPNGLYLLQNVSTDEGRSAAVVGHEDFGLPWLGFLWAAKLPDGASIGPSGEYVENYTNMAMADHGAEYIPFGEWLFGAQHEYVGLRFTAADMSVHYGWVRLDVDSTFDVDRPRATVIDWAYESIADTPIIAGAVPEPPVWMLGAIGGLALLLRRPRATR